MVVRKREKEGRRGGGCRSTHRFFPSAGGVCTVQHLGTGAVLKSTEPDLSHCCSAAEICPPTSLRNLGTPSATFMHAAPRHAIPTREEDDLHPALLANREHCLGLVREQEPSEHQSFSVIIPAARNIAQNERHNQRIPFRRGRSLLLSSSSRPPAPHLSLTLHIRLASRTRDHVPNPCILPTHPASDAHPCNPHGPSDQTASRRIKSQEELDAGARAQSDAIVERLFCFLWVLLGFALYCKLLSSLLMPDASYSCAACNPQSPLALKLGRVRLLHSACILEQVWARRTFPAPVGRCHLGTGVSIAALLLHLEFADNRF